MQIVIDVDKNVVDKVIWFLSNIKGVKINISDNKYLNSNEDVVKTIQEEKDLTLNECKKWEEFLNEL